MAISLNNHVKMLKGDFYTVLKKEHGEGELLYNIKLNSEHPIYSGHFPDVPVTPGVCQVEIIKECLEDGLKKKLFLKSSKDIKFAGLNNPKEKDELLVKITYSLQDNDLIKVNATLVDNQENVVLKLRGEFCDQI